MDSTRVHSMRVHCAESCSLHKFQLFHFSKREGCNSHATIVSQKWGNAVPYAFTYIRQNTRTYTHKHTYTYTHIHIHTHTYTHTQTHTHTNTLTSRTKVFFSSCANKFDSTMFVWVQFIYQKEYQNE